jgi:hypothetical protein
LTLAEQAPVQEGEESDTGDFILHLPSFDLSAFSSMFQAMESDPSLGVTLELPPTPGKEPSACLALMAGCAADAGCVPVG